MNNYILKLNLLIYPAKIIEQAIYDYQSVIQVNIKSKTNLYWICEFVCNPSDFVIIRNEFFNYLIALYNYNEGA